MQQLDVVERLGDQVVRTIAQGLYGALQGSVSRNDDHFRGGMAAFDGLEDIHAGDPRHHQVGHDEIERIAIEHGDGAFSVFGRGDAVSFLGQRLDDELPHRVVIVDDQDAAAWLASVRDGTTSWVRGYRLWRRDLSRERKELGSGDQAPVKQPLAVQVEQAALDDAPLFTHPEPGDAVDRVHRGGVLPEIAQHSRREVGPLPRLRRAFLNDIAMLPLGLGHLLHLRA